MERQRQKAFTLIELLVAMGIIIVLIGLLVVGLTALSGGQKANKTQATLQVAMAMQTEMVTANQLSLLYDTTTPANNDLDSDMGGTGDISTNSGAQRTAAITTFTDFSKWAAQYQQVKKLRDAQPKETVKYDGNDFYLLDAWDNPIVYVKPTGKLTNLLSDAYTGNPRPTFEVEAPDGLGFFVSAGDDGNLQERDDNLLSFEQ